MGRHHRSYLPGRVFHITSRINGREPWLVEDIRDRVVDIILAPKNCDARILALCVMPNHFHLLVRQGTDPLGQLMMNVKRRIALLVQRQLKRTGCIFERRFFEKPCLDRDYLRTVLAYIHLNPWVAGMCDHPLAYRWSSHGHYTGDYVPAQGEEQRLFPALEYFARRGNESAEELHAEYRHFIDYVMMHHDLKNGQEAVPVAFAPFRDGALKDPAIEMVALARGRDLRDIAVSTLKQKTPNLSVDLLRARRGNNEVIEVRREIIRRATIAGYRVIDIAQFLRMSPSRVSTIAGEVVPRPPRFFTRTRKPLMAIAAKTNEE